MTRIILVISFMFIAVDFLYAKDSHVQLPESEWVKLLAFVDSCKKNKAHDQEEIKLLIQLKGEQERIITLNKQHIAHLEDADGNRKSIEEKLTAMIGGKEIQIALIEKDLKKEKRYSRYKSEMGIPAAVILGAVLVWIFN